MVRHWDFLWLSIEFLKASVLQRAQLLCHFQELFHAEGFQGTPGAPDQGSKTPQQGQGYAGKCTSGARGAAPGPTLSAIPAVTQVTAQPGAPRARNSPRHGDSPTDRRGVTHAQR